MSFVKIIRPSICGMVTSPFFFKYQFSILQEERLHHFTPQPVKMGHSSLPNDKIWAFTKLKAFADDRFNVAKITISLFDRVENMMGKRENTGTSIFSFSPSCFRKLSVSVLVKVGIVCRVHSLTKSTDSRQSVSPKLLAICFFCISKDHSIQ